MSRAGCLNACLTQNVWELATLPEDDALTKFMLPIFTNTHGIMDNIKHRKRLSHFCYLLLSSTSQNGGRQWWPLCSVSHMLLWFVICDYSVWVVIIVLCCVILQCIHHIILASSQGVVPPLHAELSDLSCTGCHGSRSFPQELPPPHNACWQVSLHTQCKFCLMNWEEHYKATTLKLVFSFSHPV